MKLSKQIKLLKILVYVYVVFLSLTGLCQAVIGAMLLWEHSAFNAIAQNNFWGPAAVILSLGLIAQFFCWFGWSSTKKKKKCYLALFNVLLIVLVIMQSLTCFWAFKLRNTLIPRSVSFETKIDDSFEESLKRHTNPLEFSNKWDFIQEQYQCCGVDGNSDYRRATWGISWSCCAQSEDPFMTGCTNFYQRGCLGVIIHTIKRLLLYASLTAFVAAVLQSVGLFCSIQLISSLKQNENIDDVDTSSMSFRQKLERELKPLSSRTRTRTHHKVNIEESIPDTIQSTNF